MKVEGHGRQDYLLFPTCPIPGCFQAVNSVCSKKILQLGNSRFLSAVSKKLELERETRTQTELFRMHRKTFLQLQPVANIDYCNMFQAILQKIFYFSTVATEPPTCAMFKIQFLLHRELKVVSTQARYRQCAVVREYQGVYLVTLKRFLHNSHSHSMFGA